jgi:tRNA pseudouridine38-40 synthase
MVANFQTESAIPPQGFLKGLNSILPDDIRILAVQDVPLEFHARFHAIGKEYVYRIFAGEIMPPTERLYAAHLFCRLDKAAMQVCLNQIVGSHDFSSFEATGSRDPAADKGMGAVRRLSAARIFADHSCKDFFTIVISGNGFLRHMVRNIAGTLFEVGKGKFSPTDFGKILAARDRTLAGPTAPAKGLLLREVFY